MTSHDLGHDVANSVPDPNKMDPEGQQSEKIQKTKESKQILEPVAPLYTP